MVSYLRNKFLILIGWDDELDTIAVFTIVDVECISLAIDQIQALGHIREPHPTRLMLDLILDICDKQFSFADFEACRDWFKNLINLLRQMNYSPWQSEAFNSYREQISKLTEDNGE